MKIIAYYRIAPNKPDRAELSLEAQQVAVNDYAENSSGKVVGAFTEIEETKLKKRPEFDRALAKAVAEKATLVISRMDTLSRNAVFLGALHKSGARFLALDMPEITDQNIATYVRQAEDALRDRKRQAKELRAAEWEDANEGKKGSKKGRLKAGRHNASKLRLANKDNQEVLAKAQKKTQKYIDKLRPILEDIRTNEQLTHRQIGAELTKRGVKTIKGSAWQPSTVKILIDKLDKTQD